MSLEGDLSELPFAELVQLYGSGRQPVAVHIEVPGAPSAERGAVFCLEEGKLTGARFGKLSGRPAFRRALALKEGSFRVEVGVRASPPAEPVPITEVLFEELANLDREREQPARKPRGANGSDRETTFETSLPSLDGARPREAGPSQEGRNGAARSSTAAAAPAASRAAPEPVAAPSIPARPMAKGDAPPSSGTRKGLAIGVVAAVVVAGAGTALLLSRGARSEQAPATGPRQAAPAPRTDRTVRGAVRGVTQGEVLFGMASPLNGANRDLGRSMKLGIELAFAQANDAGGIAGRKLRLVALDDQNEPEASARAVRDLLEQHGVFGIVGNAGTTTASAALPVVLGSKAIYVGAVSGAPTLRKDPPDRYVFNYRPSLAEETSAAVRYLTSVRRVAPDRIAVFAEADEFGDAGFAGVGEAMRAAGRDPARVIRASYERNSANVDAAVARLAKVPDLEAVVMVATYLPAARLVQQLKAKGLKLVYTNVSSVDAAALAERLREARVPMAKDVVVTQVVPNPFSHATFVMRYRKLLEEKAVGEGAGALSLEGYLVGTLLVEGLRRAGPDLDTDKLVAALESIQDLDIGIGTPLTFGPRNHQASHKVWGTMLDASWTYQAVELE